MGGIAIAIWHYGKSNYDEVRWIPEIAVNRLEARAIAFRLLMEDGLSTKVEVRFGPSEVITALSSHRRLCRLKAQWTKREPLEAVAR